MDARSTGSRVLTRAPQLRVEVTPPNITMYRRGSLAARGIAEAPKPRGSSRHVRGGTKAKPPCSATSVTKNYCTTLCCCPTMLHASPNLCGCTGLLRPERPTTARKLLAASRCCMRSSLTGWLQLRQVARAVPTNPAAHADARRAPCLINRHRARAGGCERLDAI